MEDPLIYGAGKIKKANNAEFFCSCGLIKETSPRIHFDSRGMHIEYISKEIKREEINYSEIEEAFIRE